MIKELPSPAEIADELLNNAFLTEDQANAIAADVYQPLKENIERMEMAISIMLDSSCFSVEVEDAADNALRGYGDE